MIIRKVCGRINRKLRKIMVNRPNLKCFLKICRRIWYKDFRKYIASYGNNINKPKNMITIPIYRLGEKNKGKVIMLLENDSGHGGFCALWIYFLNRLSFSDRMGFYHVINWYHSDFYQEHEEYKGTNNIFEYYFEQPAGISVTDAKESDSVIFDYNCDDYDFYSVFHPGSDGDYKFSSKDIENFGIIQKKYIHLHPDLEKKIFTQINSLIGNGEKVLAVHARGGDTKVGYKNHPIPTSAFDYLEEVKNVMQQELFDYVFLATDDLDILKLFQEEFPNKVLFYSDVNRSKGDVANFWGNSERENHHYKLGEELIRDVYTLAKCSGIICGMSYVSIMAQIIKESNNESYNYFKRIFKGIAKDGIDLTSQVERKKVEDNWKKETT